MAQPTGARARARILMLLAVCLLPSSALAQYGGDSSPAPMPQPPPAPAPKATPVTAEAQGASVWARTFDALVVRPLSFAVLPIGVAAFIPAALTTAPNGRDSVESALELFVMTPAHYVFQRPLGEF